MPPPPPTPTELSRLLHFVTPPDAVPPSSEHPLTVAVNEMGEAEVRALLVQSLWALAKERERGGAALAAAEAESESIALSLLATAYVSRERDGE